MQPKVVLTRISGLFRRRGSGLQTCFGARGIVVGCRHDVLHARCRSARSMHAACRHRATARVSGRV